METVTRDKPKRDSTRRMSCIPDMNNLQPVSHLPRKILDIFSVLSRQQHRLDPGTQRSDELLLDAPYRRDASAEGDFALVTRCVSNESGTKRNVRKTTFCVPMISHGFPTPRKKKKKGKEAYRHGHGGRYR